MRNRLEIRHSSEIRALILPNQIFFKRLFHCFILNWFFKINNQKFKCFPKFLVIFSDSELANSARGYPSCKTDSSIFTWKIKYFSSIYCIKLMWCVVITMWCVAVTRWCVAVTMWCVAVTRWGVAVTRSILLFCLAAFLLVYFSDLLLFCLAA